jgi:hypothetical protein
MLRTELSSRPPLKHLNPDLYHVVVPKPNRGTYDAHFSPTTTTPTNKKTHKGMNFNHFYKTRDLAHGFHHDGRLGRALFSAVPKAGPTPPGQERKPRTLPRRHNQTSGPRAPMGALLQPKFRVRLSRPSRHIAKRTNRINRLIWISPVDELMKGHIFPGIFTPHTGVPGNRGCGA